MKLALSAVLLAAAASAASMPCAQLAATSFGKDVTVAAARTVAATANLPEHCEITGVIWPEAKFVVKLPTAWNNRFQMVGNGGWAGTLSTAAVNSAIGLGYASASTDTGHDAAKDTGATFAMPSATNPHAMRKVIDHGYLSIHETVLLAKKMVQAFYGSAPQYSYYVGCSTGGRQGLMEAQRYPEDFDGYVIGAPVLNLTGLQMKAVYNWIQIGPGPGELKPEHQIQLGNAVYAKCDSIDGVKDGLIENPMVCNFDPDKDLKKCSAGQSGLDCFTAAQIAAIKKVYDGVRNSHGDLLFPGKPYGSEAVTTSAGRGGAPVTRSAWDGGMFQSFGLGDTFMKYMATPDAPGANWDYKTMDVDTLPARMASVAQIINATLTDLSAVQARGAKIVHYHGWADQGVTARMSVDYFNAVQKTMGSTKDFYRFFPVPGMFHCQGGPGCGNADWLSAVRDWVENDKAPDMIVGAHVEAAKTTRTRPLCSFPSVAKYKGSGSIDEAASFSCVAP